MKILFDLWPATGHFNATYNFAKKLKEMGHEVVYLVDIDREQTVKDLGFETYKIDLSLFPAHLTWHNYFTGMLDNCLNHYDSQRWVKFKRIINTYYDMLFHLQPDHVFIDAVHGYKGLIYRSRFYRFDLIKSTIRTQADPYSAPYNSTCIPPKTKVGRFMSKLVWERTNMVKAFNTLRAKVFSAGLDNVSFLKKYAEITSADMKQLDWSYFGSYMSFKDVHEVILSPEAFDVYPNENKRLIYINTFTDFDGRNLEGKTNDPRLNHILDKISRIKKDSNGKVKLVYVSFGTLSVMRMKVLYRFFRDLEKVAARHKDKFVFIVSYGNFLETKKIPYIADNVFYFRQVPQTNVLLRADIMVTHGGMNSITECLLTDTPMIGYPLMTNWDQPGNAARVQYHSLGLKGSLGGNMEYDIEYKLIGIYEHLDLYKALVKNFREQNMVIESTETVRDKLSVIKSNYEF
jgi:zeaxanthin glucosyltransferase